MDGWMCGVTAWLTDWPSGFLHFLLTDWLTCLVTGWLTALPAEQLTDWLPSHWLTDPFTFLAPGWLTDLLTEYMNKSVTKWEMGCMDEWASEWLCGVSQRLKKTHHGLAIGCQKGERAKQRLWLMFKHLKVLPQFHLHNPRLTTVTSELFSVCFIPHEDSMSTWHPQGCSTPHE